MLGGVVLLALLLAWRIWPERPQGASLYQPRVQDIAVTQSNGAGLLLPLHPPGANATPSAHRRLESRTKVPNCDAEQRREFANWVARQPPAATPDADIAQALMRELADRELSHHELFGRLTLRWPHDVAAAWVSWEHCPRARGCDQLARARHLVVVDGNNGAAWLALMDSALHVRDEATQEYALARAARSPVFDMRRGGTYTRLYAILLELPPSPRCWPHIANQSQEISGEPMTPAEYADLAAHGSELAVAIPGYGLREACMDGEGHRLAPSRRMDCISVLARLADQPTISDQLRALRLLIPLLGRSETSRFRQEQYRQLLWLLRKMPFVRFPLGSGARIWAQGEVDFFQSQLLEQGLWPPPPDWLPADEDSRKLILDAR